jgi:diguanylate cyclase (GGDEF)-like protein/PAS domain S-box-containing protein
LLECVVRPSHETLAMALSIIADAVLATDTERAIVYMNPAAESLTGWRTAEAEGEPLERVFFLVDRDSDRLVDSPLEAANRSNVALVNRRGLQVGIEYTTAVARDEGGALAGAVVVFRARRLAAEIALKSSNDSLLANADALFEERERAQVTLDAIGDAVISTNFSGRVSYLNLVAERLTGWSQGEAAGTAVDAIFRLVEAATREPVPSPTVRAIIDNRRILVEAVCVLLRRDGREVPVEVSAAPIHDRLGGVVGAVMVARDVTAARDLSQKLARLALYDNLTDLPNRALFEDRLAHAMAEAIARGGHAAVLYVDLDRFKHVNDTLGHGMGDQLLKTAARRLQGCVRSSDTVSRHGGDEFVVLLAHVTRIQDAVVCAGKILEALAAPFRLAEQEAKVTVSVGIAVFPEHAADAAALLRCADQAMYRAKEGGRNTFRLFEPS